MIDLVILVGANDIIVYDNGAIDVLTTPEDFNLVKDILDASSLKVYIAKISFVSSIKVDLNTYATSMLYYI